MEHNVRLWNRFKTPPPEAKKQIGAGRLKGMTDINPMWRMLALTQAFGPVGFGWKYTVTRKWTEPGNDGIVAAFVDIDLFVKDGDEWSAAIPGTGGSMLVAKETSGLHTTDEAYKMALTDAISVSCKALGVGADVYWNANTKYTNYTPTPLPSGPVNKWDDAAIIAYEFPSPSLKGLTVRKCFEVEKEEPGHGIEWLDLVFTAPDASETDKDVANRAKFLLRVPEAR